MSDPEADSHGICLHILLVHNEYGKLSGEEMIVRSLRDLLVERGHRVTPHFRSSAEFTGRPVGVAKAFFSGVYNPFSHRAIRSLLREHRADLAHIHNLFPLISPSILSACRREGVPVVMTVHNYRLTCPSGLHLRNGQVCEKCLGGREYHCVLNRCEGSMLKSAGYALRSAVARRLRLFHDNVTMYAALTEFQRQRLVDAGFPARRIAVIPNMVGESVAQAAESPDALGEFIGFAGRVSPEKGLPTLLAAAAAMPDVPFRIAGSYERMPHLVAQAPANVQFLGHVTGGQLADFYRLCRIVVLTSTCFEGFPTVLPEAMLHAKPVVCSRIGGLPDIVDEGATGLLFQPGNHTDLTDKLRRLWSDPALCRTLGAGGRAKAASQYSRSRYYERLMEVYRRALQMGPGGDRFGETAKGSAIVPSS